jgi:hypothetical protein
MDALLRFDLAPIIAGTSWRIQNKDLIDTACIAKYGTALGRNTEVVTDFTFVDSLSGIGLIKRFFPRSNQLEGADLSKISLKLSGR